MKTLKSIILIGLLCSPQVVSASGDKVGGGGMVVTCKDSSGAISSTDLLDVYEVKNNPHLNMMQSSGDLTEDIMKMYANTAVLGGYSSSSAYINKEWIASNLREFMARIEWVDTLTFLNDQGKVEVEISKNCKLEQLAIFFDSDHKIQVNQQIWLRLDSLNRAALVNHELFYRDERISKEDTSESTRSYVRQILSPSSYDGVLKGQETAYARGVGTLIYGSEDNTQTEFLVHRVKNSLGTEDTQVQFITLNGRPLLVKTYVEIKDFSLLVNCQTRENREPQKVCKPSVVTNKIFHLPVITEHRKDWEVEIKYYFGAPVSIALLQDGVRISESVLTNLDLNEAR